MKLIKCYCRRFSVGWSSKKVFSLSCRWRDPLLQLQQPCLEAGKKGLMHTHTHRDKSAPGSQKASIHGLSGLRSRPTGPGLRIPTFKTQDLDPVEEKNGSGGSYYRENKLNPSYVENPSIRKLIIRKLPFEKKNKDPSENKYQVPDFCKVFNRICHKFQHIKTFLLIITK